ncbi:hypothetical protein [Streptomyces sp. NPDC021622]|uniref:hypothetical protein n=1 Tax=Streptomyces sp. NPDC021622 TaxID=3155013 RepID=UPI0033C79B97
MAQIIPAGKYYIRCAAFTDRVAEVYEAVPEPNIPIVGFPLDKQPEEQWHVETIPGQALQVIRSELTTPDDRPLYWAEPVVRAMPEPVVVNLFPMRFSIEPAGKVGNVETYRVHDPSRDLVATLLDGDEMAQIFLAKWRGDNTQKWFFESA